MENTGETLSQTHVDLNKRYHNRTDIVSHFWKRWKNEYLTSLREFHRTFGNNNQNINVGDVVQIQEDSPRVNWKLAVIEELVHGNDGMVRSVKLRTTNGLTNRPVSKLYPLEVSPPRSQDKECHPERRSKLQAKDKIRKWTS